MELAAEAVGGLHLAGDSFRIVDKCFTKLVNHAIKGLLDKRYCRSILDDPSLNEVEQGVIKQAYYGITTLLVEAARQGTDIGILQSFLEDCKFSTERANYFCKIFQENNEELTTQLRNVTFHLPHIVDVNWRLDYCVKSSHLDKLNQPTYLISLTTEKGCGRSPEQVMFTCTVEQLQDLVGKLKDAMKCWEKKSEDATV